MPETRRAPEDAEAAGSRAGNSVPEPDVAALFDSIAPVYDRMNTIMTAGLDGRWRRAAVRAARLVPGDSVLDVACGTGKLTAALALVVGPLGKAVGVDLAPAMLEEARRSWGDIVQVEFRLANALALPVEDSSFEAATIAFGLRNLASFEDGFREMARVVRPGGRVVCLELSVPRPKPIGRLYEAAFNGMAPTIGSFFRRRAEYAYLPHTLEGFPDPIELAATMRRAGLANVSVRRLALGAVALHVGTVPGAEASRPASRAG
ncbi:MAG TPA: ubiquinone/menaquinone biosynthesis methyltransferase [Candidatus Limnocylindrales bacterium]